LVIIKKPGNLSAGNIIDSNLYRPIFRQAIINGCDGVKGIGVNIRNTVGYWE
jgi:hypothetical protein